MARETRRPAPSAASSVFAPGQPVALKLRTFDETREASSQGPRDCRLRSLYLETALGEIPRLLGAIDRHPLRPTFGCLDRQYWHYRTASFPSEMYQEGVLPLAMVYALKLPDNRWYQHERIGALAEAALRFNLRASHADGSCDDYYPFERALGAAVFSLQAAARAYQLLELDDPELLGWMRRRADWLVKHDESGRLANHHALAAVGLLRVAEISGEERYRQAADAYVDRVLQWQDAEGWFHEYDGADPGYQTVTIDCLARYRQATGQTRLDEPLARAVAFARHFLHPDHSYAGPYGSRGTTHFYPHGFELLASSHAAAAELADGFLQSLASGTYARLDDDRMFAHRLAGLIDAYLAWTPQRPSTASTAEPNPIRYFPNAQILVRRLGVRHTVISAARGGVFRHFATSAAPVTDAGLVVETEDDRVAVSQWHDRSRPVEMVEPAPHCTGGLVVHSTLGWYRHETATPLKQAVLHLGMYTVGRWCRTLVRRLLQRRLITGVRPAPIHLTRKFEFLPQREAFGGPGLRVTDTIELSSRRLRVRRMFFGTDHESAYVAASGLYQDAALEPWTDLAPYIDELNAERRVVIVREL